MNYYCTQGFNKDSISGAIVVEAQSIKEARGKLHPHTTDIADLSRVTKSPMWGSIKQAIQEGEFPNI